jgi:hypothetical protein
VGLNLAGRFRQSFSVCEDGVGKYIRMSTKWVTDLFASALLSGNRTQPNVYMDDILFILADLFVVYITSSTL